MYPAFVFHRCTATSVRTARIASQTSFRPGYLKLTSEVPGPGTVSRGRNGLTGASERTPLVSSMTPKTFSFLFSRGLTPVTVERSSSVLIQLRPKSPSSNHIKCRGPKVSLRLKRSKARDAVYGSVEQSRWSSRWGVQVFGFAAPRDVGENRGGERVRVTKRRSAVQPSKDSELFFRHPDSSWHGQDERAPISLCRWSTRWHAPSRRARRSRVVGTIVGEHDTTHGKGSHS
jgi:hypothetical protein